MLPGLEPSDPQAQKERDERGKRIIIALLFLLLSFSCIFCSSQSALWLINRDRVETSMRSSLTADYGFDPALSLAPLSESIIAEAAQDEAALLAEQTPIAVGLGVVILPNPVPTPAPTLIALLPTPTLTPTVSAPPNPAPATPIAPTATSVPPTSAPPTSPPASPPPTSLPATALPTVSPPTLPPPTVPPTVVPPTVPPPTVPPPTVPPPTVPPTAVPPTAPPTTAPPTATATNIPPTATPIPPTVAFSAAAYSVNENGGNAVIAVVLSAASSQTVTVTYAAADGTATAGSDYNPPGGILTFAPGQTSQTFNVAVINDTIASEGNETVLLSLSNPTNATLGLSSATLTIADDDATPTVQFSQPGYTIGEALNLALIDVTLSTASAVTVTVNFATTAGSATSGVDYQDNSGTLTFAPGQVSQTFNVTINDDALDEADETVDLSLSTPVNATLGTQNTAVLTIADDDASPTVQFSTSNYSVNENGGSASIDVTLSTASGVTVTVDYATSDLTATTADGDYSTATGQLTFPPGSTSQTFSVTINDDTLDEPNETVRLTLSNPNGATPGTPFAATLTIIDNDVAGGQCSGVYPNGEPNIGSPNGITARIGCDVGIILDLGTVISTGHPGPDLIYYEMQGNGPPPPPYYVFMDLVTVEVGPTPGGPWYPVFVWGDGNSDTNTNVSGLDTGPASDNMTISSPPLVGPGDPFNLGVEIDIDTAPGGPPAGSYQYVRIYSPPTGVGDSDGPEVDAIQIVP
ncbi:MAG: hypothetical protein KJ077_21745 [Anaerolineae bacterium]|nr:hypothetical protein [Anaerolineae bacterium]